MKTVLAMATDMFLCLFGIFAVMQAVAAKHPLPEVRVVALQVKWKHGGAYQSCIMGLTVSSAGRALDLDLPDPIVATIDGPDCNFIAPITGGLSDTVKIGLYLPFLKGAATVNLGSEQGIQLPSTSDGIATFIRELKP